MTPAQARQLVAGRSMFNAERWAVLDDALTNLPPGALYEFGCHQAGTLAYLALLHPDRTCYGYDTFGTGTTGTNSAVDGDLRDGLMATSFNDVRSWLASLNLTNTILIPGDVRTTASGPPPEPIALAIIDLNISDPTTHVLDWLLANADPTATILVDDIGFPGVAAALDKLHRSGLATWSAAGYMGRVHIPTP